MRRRRSEQKQTKETKSELQVCVYTSVIGAEVAGLNNSDCYFSQGSAMLLPSNQGASSYESPIASLARPGSSSLRVLRDDVSVLPWRHSGGSLCGCKQLQPNPALHKLGNSSF